MRILLAGVAAALIWPSSYAQQTDPSWQACTALGDPARRLACFDGWAQGRASVPPEQAAVPSPPAAAPEAPHTTNAPEVPPRRGVRLTATEGCHDTRYSQLSRFWELEAGADCGTFGIRGYRPISLDVVTASSVNRQPTSGNPANNATLSTDYRTAETRLQLSLRTKIAQGLFAYGDSGMDSLWLAYSQQSYWQLFTPSLSRPFRSTDHEPEVMYVRPLQAALPGAWRLRMGGLGLVHQSNGQPLPLSRSWNRVYLMGALEHDRVQVQARVWHRLRDGSDDNPGISDFIGRGELSAQWNASRENLFSVTARHALRRNGHGSVRLEWFRTLADTGMGLPSGLRLHTQLFTGYGDTLLDYNRQRTVFSVGLSLVEW